MKNISLLRSFVVLLVFASCTSSMVGKKSPANFVDPFIGTATVGHTYPAATLPFGMVQVGPDTGIDEWKRCSGYHSDDSSIMGFSHTHVSGTGAAEMGDILIMPTIGEPQFEPGTRENPDLGYRSRFNHATELARPGYYAVKLDDSDIYAEMTATYRAGFHCYTFPESKQAGMVLDMNHGIGDGTVEGSIQAIDNKTITGHRQSSGFINNHRYYFCARFSKPFEKITSFVDGQIAEQKDLKGKACKAFVHFTTSGKEKIMVKVGISTVSAEGAMKNLDQEIPGWNFEQVAEAALQIWNENLSKIDVQTTTDSQKKIFYTALYHNLIMPNLITDVDGSYRGWDREIHKSSDGDLYTNFSLWDTYRASHPLYAMLYPEKNIRFINSMLERYKQIGQLPINEYGANETYCMIGYHSVPVISEAILKDQKGFDYELAYEAMRKSAMDDNRGIGFLKKMNYIPSELDNNSVSKVLEYAYDDWCLAQVAKKLSKNEDVALFTNRAKSYQNLFDASVGFMRGKHADGSWVSPFDPKAVSILGQGDFTEGSSWQYSFYVPQNISNLIDLMGGDEKFSTKLDDLFNTVAAVENEKAVDVTGLIGQYAHGNEPSHHIAYLYNYSGQPWKTQKVVNQIKTTLYLDTRDGLCGNDDCGQMSAWYVFSSLGFYPVTPGMDYYTIGSPSVKSATLHLPNGKEFRIKAENVSDQNFYIQAATLNNQAYSQSYLKYSDIENGGQIEYKMGMNPNNEWGAKKNEPVSSIPGN